MSEANPLAPRASAVSSFGPVLWAKKGSTITKKTMLFSTLVFEDKMVPRGAHMEPRGYPNGYLFIVFFAVFLECEKDAAEEVFGAFFLVPPTLADLGFP